MMTQAGPVCDVCGQYIIFDTSINPFSVGGIEQTLLCHDDCKHDVLAMAEQQNWRVLREGPLRKVYEEQEQANGDV